MLLQNMEVETEKAVQRLQQSNKKKQILKNGFPRSVENYIVFWSFNKSVFEKSHLKYRVFWTIVSPPPP